MLGEQHAIHSQLVELGRAHVRMSVGGDVPPPLVIGEDEDDVGLCGGEKSGLLKNEKARKKKRADFMHGLCFYCGAVVTRKKFFTPAPGAGTVKVILRPLPGLVSTVNQLSRSIEDSSV